MKRPVEQRLCACGCGKTFRVKRPYPYQKYLDAKHRWNAWAKTHPRVKVAA